MTRVLAGGIKRLRAEYQFPLAHLCHTGPGEVRRMRLGEFANLIDGCDALIEARRRAAG